MEAEIKVMISWRGVRIQYAPTAKRLSCWGISPFPGPRIFRL